MAARALDSELVAARALTGEVTPRQNRRGIPSALLVVYPVRRGPDHPAYQQIMAVFTTTDGPLRARQVCEAMDLKITPNTVNNARLKLKRLVERGILTETEQGLFTQPRP